MKIDTDPDETGRLAAGTLAYLSATDRELCAAIRTLEDKAKALAPTDPAIYGIAHELNRLRQELIYARRKRK